MQSAKIAGLREPETCCPGLQTTPSTCLNAAERLQVRPSVPLSVTLLQRLFEPTSQLGRLKIVTSFLQRIDRIPNQSFEVGDSLFPHCNRSV